MEVNRVTSQVKRSCARLFIHKGQNGFLFVFFFLSVVAKKPPHALQDNVFSRRSRVDDARRTQHDKGRLSERSSTVKKKKRQPDHMKCNHVRPHATVGCHAHNPEGSGGWGDDGSLRARGLRAGAAPHPTPGNNAVCVNGTQKEVRK